MPMKVAGSSDSPPPHIIEVTRVMPHPSDSAMMSMNRRSTIGRWFTRATRSADVGGAVALLHTGMPTGFLAASLSAVSRSRKDWRYWSIFGFSPVPSRPRNVFTSSFM
jgi:hypothetical protein